MAKKSTNQVLKVVFFSIVRFTINLLILYLFIQLFLFAYRFAYQVFANEAYEPNNKATVMVTIYDDTSVMELATSLEEEGVIANRYTFFVRYRFSKYNGQFQIGTYEVSPSMKMDEILAKLSAQEQNEGET